MAVAHTPSLIGDVGSSLPVFLLRTPGRAVASATAIVRTGTRHEPLSGQGLTHLLEHALFEGHRRAGTRTPAERLELLGGEVNAVTSAEYVAFQFRGTTTTIENATGVLLGAVLRPRWAAGSWPQIRRVVSEELRSSASDPFEAVKDVFSGSVFPNHPLGRPVGGSRPRVGRARLSDVLAYHHDHFRAGRVALILVGDLLARDAERVAETWLGSPDSNQPDKVATQRPPGRSAARHKRKGSGPDAYVMLGGRAAAYRDRVRPAYDVLSVVMAGSTISRLYRKIRSELGMAYYIDSWHTPYTDSGMWRIHIGCAARNVEAVIEEATTSLREVQRGVSGRMLNAARRIAVARHLLELEGSADLALEFGRNVWIGGVEGWTVEAYAASIAKVTPADLRRAASDLWDVGVCHAIACR